MSTPRLTFSRAAYLRRVAMSYDKSIFVIAEGKDYDRYFIEKVFDGSPRLRRAGYEIKLVSQISHNGASSGGKAAVIAFYEYCKDEQKLVQSNSGGRRAMCFFVDRDTQHITGGKKRSPHVVYTVLADVEAHAIMDADQVDSLASAASLDRATARLLATGIRGWATDLADIWRPWIEECYVAEGTRARCWVGFGSVSSRIHSGARCDALVKEKLAHARTEIARTTLLSAALYKIRRREILAKVDKVYATGGQASLLKGKWLPTVLARRVGAFFASTDSPDGWNSESFKAVLVRCFLANLRQDAPNIRRLRTQFEGLL